jgi:hypothetical protein
MPRPGWGTQSLRSPGRRPATLKASRGTHRGTRRAANPEALGEARGAIDPEIRSARILRCFLRLEPGHEPQPGHGRRSPNSERPGSTAARLRSEARADNSPRARRRRAVHSVSHRRERHETHEADRSTRDTRKAPNKREARLERTTRSRAKRQALAIMSPRAGQVATQSRYGPSRLPAVLADDK